MKAGWKTSEFWVALIPTVLVFLSQIGMTDLSDSENGELAAKIAAGVTAVAYVVGRSIVKSKNPTA